MHFRGDWKYLRQIFCLRRHYGTEGICHCCSATKGKKDQTLNFTDLSDEAAWRATVFRCPPPWQVEPEFAKLDFFHLGMLSMDVLHVWHLGIARDLSLG